MTQSDRQMQQMFVHATDEVVPAAPWLEGRIVDAIHQRSRGRRLAFRVDAFRGFGSGLRLTAGLVAIVVVIAAIAGLLMTTRLLHNPPAPGSKSTVQTPLPFRPSPAVRAANWPPGGPVPAELAGAWQPPLSAPACKASNGCILHLGVYTFQVGEEYLNPPPPGNVTPPVYGNVVVNGSEIDFMSDVCTQTGDFGFERFTYKLTGNTLVITRAAGPGQSTCWEVGQTPWPSLALTYTRVGTAAQSPLPFTPSPAVRAANWPAGGPVPTAMAGAWQPANYNNVLHLGGYTFEFGDEYAFNDTGTICGPGPCPIGNVVVNGSEIDFIQDPCGRVGYGYERFSYTLNGDTLVLTRLDGPGQSNCGLLMAGTYTRVRSAGA